MYTNNLLYQGFIQAIMSTNLGDMTELAIYKQDLCELRDLISRNLPAILDSTDISSTDKYDFVLLDQCFAALHEACRDRLGELSQYDDRPPAAKSHISGWDEL